MKILGKRRFGLVAKELHEQASRRRTFVTRTIFAGLLFGIFLIFYLESIDRGNNSGFSSLGHGRIVFDFSVIAAFLTTAFLLPLLVVGVVTSEKQQDSLSLLLITDLRPGEILTEKVLSRLIPFLGYLSLTLPLLGFSYALGGVSAAKVFGAIYFLGIFCLQVSAIALFFSCLCHSTATSFLLTYILGAAIYFGPALLADATGASWNTTRDLLGIFPMFYYFEPTRAGNLTQQIVQSWFMWPFALGFLVAARLVFLRRAFVKPKNALKLGFQKIDRFFHRITPPSLSWGAADDGPASLPSATPVRWRELTTKALGRPRYLLRIFLALFTVAVISCLYAYSEYTRRWRFGRGESEEFATIVFTLWILSALALVVVSANLASSERTHQTLDVLLTTPLRGRDIIRQKLSAAFRIGWLLAGVFLVVFVMEGVSESEHAIQRSRYFQPLGPYAYVGLSMLWVLLYFPMLIWLSTLIGLRVKSRARATMVAVVSVGLWQILPLMGLGLLAWLADLDRGPWILLGVSSPMSALVVTEFFGQLYYEVPLRATGLPILLNIGFYSIFTLYLRSRCLNRADQLLGRG